MLIIALIYCDLDVISTRVLLADGLNGSSVVEMQNSTFPSCILKIGKILDPFQMTPVFKLLETKIIVCVQSLTSRDS